MAAADAAAAQQRLADAAAAGDCAQIEAALSAGADVNAVRTDAATPWTPLTRAVHGWHVDAVALLLARGARVRMKVVMGHEPWPVWGYISWADSSRWDACVAIARLLLAAGADVNAADWQGTALAAAAGAGCAAGVRLLVDAGADVSSAKGRRMTPLHQAAGCPAAGPPADPAGCVEALLAAGADARAWDIDGARPAHWAARTCGPQHVPAVLRLLVAAGADVNAPTRWDSITPLEGSLAFRAGTGAIVPTARALLAAGAQAGFSFWRRHWVTSLPRAEKATLLGEAAWARRGHLCRLRRVVNPNSEQAAADEAKAAATASETATAAAAAARLGGQEAATAGIRAACTGADDADGSSARAGAGTGMAVTALP
jgi:ankyrin repeat protein